MKKLSYLKAYFKEVSNNSLDVLFAAFSFYIDFQRDLSKEK
jgi:hypothetical protein